jgi:hypothetical protein
MHLFGFEVNPAARCGEQNHRFNQNQRTLVTTIGLYAKISYQVVKFLKKYLTFAFWYFKFVA